MRIARILLAGAVLALPAGGRPGTAGDWLPQKTGPSSHLRAQRPLVHVGTQSRPYPGPATEPSALARFNTGTRKFFADTSAGTKKFFADAGAGTQRFFANTWDTLTWNRPAAKKKSANPYLPWIRQPRSDRYLKPKKKQKKSWLGGLFRREEELPSSSLSDFMEAERLDP